MCEAPLELPVSSSRVHAGIQRGAFMQARSVFIAALSLFSASAAIAAGKDAIAFGARDALQHVSLSPDGQRVALVVPAGDRGTAAMVIDLTGAQKKTVVLKADGNPDRIQGCNWVLDTRLVCHVYGIETDEALLTGATKLFSVSADGADVKLLTARNGSQALFQLHYGGNIIDFQSGANGADSVLLTRYVVPEQQVGSILNERRQGLAVERVNVNNLSRQIVVPPNDSAFGYISDGQGNVRIMGTARTTTIGYDSDTSRYQYRMLGDTKWQLLSTEVSLPNGLSTGFTPIAVDSKLNIAYGLEGQGGRTVLASIALDGSMKHELVFDQGKVDVDGVLTIGRQRRVIGVTFATDTRQAAIFDPAIKKLADALRKALPNLPQVDIVDASADENILLLLASSDVDPGRYFIYNKTSRQLGELLSVRPQLAGRTLAKVRPIVFPAADGTQIPAYLTLPPGSDGKNLPLIVMPHGGPAARDEWGFDWLPQFFAARGYAVLQPNYRGSTGYGGDWLEKNGYQSWKTAIGDVTDAARWAIAQGMADKDKVAIFGWSYGGYAALQSAVVAPDLFKAVVAVAPVTDLDAYRHEAEKFSYYKQRDSFVGNGPHVEEGSPARHAAAIQVPVLLFHGDKDINVSIAESRLMRDRLHDARKSVELVEFTGLDHQLEDDKVRADLLDRADMFLRANLQLQ